MKRHRKKRKRTITTENERHKQPVWLSVVIGGGILVFLLIASTHRLSIRYILPPIVIGLWILGSVILWQYANAHAGSDAWWQDDSCSGWRGY